MKHKHRYRFKEADYKSKCAIYFMIVGGESFTINQLISTNPFNLKVATLKRLVRELVSDLIVKVEKKGNTNYYSIPDA